MNHGESMKNVDCGLWAGEAQRHWTARGLTYSGAIGGFGAGASGSTGGNSTLTKSGDGTQILSGTSTYTGATVVQQGTLLINGSTAAGSAFTVDSGATLGGTGTIGGIVTTSGTLSPGASIETLGSADLNFTTGATFAYETNSSAPVATGADLMKVTGNLSLSGTVALTLTDLASLATPFSPGTTFSLINYTGTWNGGLFSFGGNPLADDTIFNDGLTSWQISYNEAEGGQNYTGEYAGGTDSFVTLTATAIPEPTAALLGLTVLGLGLRRRR